MLLVLYIRKLYRLSREGGSGAVQTVNPGSVSRCWSSVAGISHPDYTRLRSHQKAISSKAGWRYVANLSTI